MECQPSDSKKLTKVFDASKRSKSRKKGRPFIDHSNSVASDGSTSVSHVNPLVRTSSAEASLQSIKQVKKICNTDSQAERDSSFDIKRSPSPFRRSTHSPRRCRMSTRDENSLALKAGLISTPKSDSRHDIESPPPDQDAFFYALFEEAIKRDKKKHRHSDRRREEHGGTSKEAHYHHRRHHRQQSNCRERRKELSLSPRRDQDLILETFAKLCSKLTDKKSAEKISRCLSHKSLQCEVDPITNYHEAEKQSTRLRPYEHSTEKITPKTRSQDTLHRRSQSRDTVQYEPDKRAYDRTGWQKKDLNEKYYSRADVRPRTCNPEQRYRDYDITPTKSRVEARENTYYDKKPQSHVCDNRKDKRPERYYDNNRRFERKTSRSFDIPRDHYLDEERCCRATARSDNIKDRRYEDYRDVRDDRYLVHDDRYLDPRRKSYVVVNKEKRVHKKDSGRYDRESEVSRDEIFKDRHTSKDRDSGYSLADGESTASNKSHYLKAVKQEITEQREAMDNMMKLWKELMRCFKSVSNSQNKNDKQQMHDNANSAKESAAEQLKLWRECMQRYETVARDVGDTDARLMEEINKQRSEMAEMATMWQECLQRYREMSNDFDKLKQQVKSKTVALETVPRVIPPQVICAEGEGPTASYRLPASYSPPPQMGNPYMGSGSPLRARASVPPWWWCGERAPEREPRRRSSPSPDSRDERDARERDTRERDRRTRHKERGERDEHRHKEKSKPAAGARSEHRHRRR